MPDATGLELIARRLRDALGEDAVTGTSYFRGQATIEVAPARVRDVLQQLRDDPDEPFGQLMSVHGCDYLPEEPRLGVHYQLIDMHRPDRIGVKTRVTVEEPAVPSVAELYPGANYHEREVYDMFGVEFDGHPDPRRIQMPEDYEGHPQRRDFPIGGEVVHFTYKGHRGGLE